jgi:hypothetical protein
MESTNPPIQESVTRQNPASSNQKPVSGIRDPLIHLSSIVLLTQEDQSTNPPIRKQAIQVNPGKSE